MRHMIVDTYGRGERKEGFIYHSSIASAQKEINLLRKSRVGEIQLLVIFNASEISRLPLNVQEEENDSMVIV